MESPPSASAAGTSGANTETLQNRPAGTNDLEASDKPELSHQPRILSLDGGGVRGLSSLLILRELMETIQRRKTLAETPKPCEYFELICGTSTGGLIAIMLGRLRMSVEECITEYMKLSKEAFDRDHAIFKVLPTGERGCRFKASNLERIIKELIKGKLKNEKATLAEIAADNEKPCRTFVVATSAAVAQGAPILFRSYSTEENNANKCAIWQAARATSAAPSFFDPIHIEIPAPGGWYVDGGLRHNNPSQLALDEARRIWPGVKRFCLVSIGTGRQSNVEFVNIKDVEPPTQKPQSAISRMLTKIPGSNVIRTVKNAPGGAKELVNIGRACVEMSTSSVPVHEAMVRAANATDPHTRFPYFRFNVESGMDTIGLEEWKALVRIGELTDQYMQEETRKCEKMNCIKTLISPAVVEHIQIQDFRKHYLVPPIYQPNPHFVGRDQVIAELQKKLATPQSETYKHRVALYGMGGVGKTQVATEYVFKFRAEYHSVFWISAATPADFQSGLQQIAKEVRCISKGAEQDAEALARAVLQWFKDNSSWLLVIDNLDDISIARGYLPEINGENCHVLITTRNRDAMGIPAQGLEIHVFDSSHAVDLLLLRATGSKDCDPEIRLIAANVVEELGYLALAIEHAAAFIRQSSLDISKFLDMYSKSRKEFLQNLPNQNHPYPRAVAATLLMSLEKVRADDMEAGLLLILFAFLNPDGILVDFLQDGLEGLDEPLKSVIANPFKFRKTLSKLGEFSLIRQSDDGQTIAIHRLVQAVIRDHIGLDVTKKVADSTTSLFLSAFPNFDEGKRQILSQLIAI